MRGSRQPSLVTELRDGDRAEIEQLYRRHYETLIRFARRRTPSLETAQDVVAGTFLTAWRRRDDMPDAELPWLYAIARNEIGTHLRSTKRLARLRLRLAGAADIAAPRAEADALGERDRIATAFNGLSPTDREVLSLHAWEGLDGPAAAAVLGISANAYAIRLHRARQRLAQELGTADALAVQSASGKRLASCLDDLGASESP